MKKLTLLLIIGTMFSAMFCYGQKVPTVKITLRVEDPEGVPIAGAEAGMAGDMNTPENGPVPRRGKGKTNSEGRFTAEIATGLGNVAVRATKEGFYAGDDGNSYKGIWLATTDEERKAAYKSGKWNPWEKEIKVVLRPVKNPVPMYAKKVEAQLPAPGTWVGYDLQAGDWVAPYGKGIIKDMEFLGSGDWKDWSNYDCKLTMRFPGEGNGIQTYVPSTECVGSEFKFPYKASAEKYQSEWTWQDASFPDPTRPRQNKTINDSLQTTYYIFRVRTVLDQNGQIKTAMYGKIPPRVEVGVGKGGSGFINFVYHLNPDGTRNLEFDSKNNLFKDSTREFSP